MLSTPPEYKANVTCDEVAIIFLESCLQPVLDIKEVKDVFVSSSPFKCSQKLSTVV